MKRIIKTVYCVLLGLLFSIPVITITDSITAMHFVNFRLRDNEDIKVFEEFMKSFKMNFKQSVPFIIFTLGLGALITMAWIDVVKSSPEINFLAAGLLLVATLIYLNVNTMFTYLLAKFDNTTKRLLVLTIYMAIGRIDVMTKLSALELLAIVTPVIIICVNTNVVSCIIGGVVFIALLVLFEMVSGKSIIPIYEFLIKQEKKDEPVEQ